MRSQITIHWPASNKMVNRGQRVVLGNCFIRCRQKRLMSMPFARKSCFIGCQRSAQCQCLFLEVRVSLVATGAPNLNAFVFHWLHIHDPHEEKFGGTPGMKNLVCKIMVLAALGRLACSKISGSIVFTRHAPT